MKNELLVVGQVSRQSCFPVTLTEERIFIKKHMQCLDSYCLTSQK